ncbi:MAG: aminoglycoside phosphotransferase family protein [Chloroflexi bacterium]|nr:aminoglycoside phosphotransferase family protein [Chloroflexota bacterium]
MAFEYISDTGEIVPGQWFSDVGRLKEVADETGRRSPEAPSSIIGRDVISILLQGRGADRKLTGLPPLLATPGARLFVHRPERRAVVRLNSDGQTQFAKIVPPDRVNGLVENCAALERLAGRSFAIPRLLDADIRRGVTVWSALAGTSLHDLPHEAGYLDASFAAGRALRNLHDLPLPEGIGRHMATAEVAVVENWMRMLREYVPQWADQVAVQAARVVKRLMTAQTPARLLHRDFYDKQIFWDGGGQIGLLDFDTLTAGEAALDVANALAHFELRALMGDVSFVHSQAASGTFLEGYAPDQEILDRLPAYQDASTLRLLCVYAFRPTSWKMLPAMLASLNQGMTIPVE